jgi:hypothetical protein
MHFRAVVPVRITRSLLAVTLITVGCASSHESQLKAPPASNAPTLPTPPPAAPSASGGVPAAATSASATPGAAAGVAGSPAASGGTAADPAARIDEDNVYGGGHQADGSASPPLLDQAGKPLPQTSERPTTKTQTFGKRMALLGQAIATGNADAALPAFFPSVAYAQVKDIPQPERDWDQRLVSAFRRDIAEYRAKLGQGAGESTLVSVDVPEQSAKLMKPGSEGNRVGYYRVLRSTLHFRLPNGQEKTLELTSMISWRGEWYVVHLHGFK